VSDWTAYGLIVTLGLVTYATRIGGHLILSRFGRLNARLEAALDAVPVAVMTAIIAPMALATGVLESIAAGIAVLAAMRLSMHATLVLSIGALVVMRWLFG
jgi:uncharacterized membrane protein